MMMALRLALRNLMGAGLRTWLNVIVLSFAFVVIIWHKGLLDAWDNQAIDEMVKWEIGGGQYWQKNYDPYDPFTLQDSHGKIPGDLEADALKGEAAPVLITQGTIYPSGRMQSILLKGIPPGQKVLQIPTDSLGKEGDAIPAIIGNSMAEASRLSVGNRVNIRWRDKNGAFDATEIIITGIFQTNVPTVDAGQVWIPLERLQQMMLLPDEATLIVSKGNHQAPGSFDGWSFRSQDQLMSDLKNLIQTKTIGGMVLWAILLMLAMLAVFDTQVLSIFRRQKEIGTYVALGMTRSQVVALFTVEGAMHSVLAALLGAVYGIPLLTWQAIQGITFPVKGDDYGISMPNTIYPVYSLGLIIATVLIILITTTVVSYWPSRKIAKMNPTDALRGKIL
jgi:ABC-type lipoprotein release transport system permease subunit